MYSTLVNKLGNFLFHIWVLKYNFIFENNLELFLKTMVIFDNCFQKQFFENYFMMFCKIKVCLGESQWLIQNRSSKQWASKSSSISKTPAQEDKQLLMDSKDFRSVDFKVIQIHLQEFVWGFLFSLYNIRSFREKLRERIQVRFPSVIAL